MYIYYIGAGRGCLAPVTAPNPLKIPVNAPKPAPKPVKLAPPRSKKFGFRVSPSGSGFFAIPNNNLIQ